MMPYYIINFETFDPFYSTLNLPVNTILFRGYSSEYDPIANRPAYYTYDYNVACSYGNLPKCKTSAFVTRKSIKLLDLRHIGSILLHIFENRKSNQIEVIEAIYTLTLSYGLCSLKRQIELVKTRFGDKLQTAIQNMTAYLQNTQGNNTVSRVNPVEIRGVRVGATSNDVFSVALLQEIFPHIDGYIAPSFESPFHVEKAEKSNKILPAEIVIFKPLQSGIEIMIHDQIASIKNDLVHIRIEEVLNGMYVFATLPFKGDIYHVWEHPTNVVTGGGGNCHTIYNPNKFFDRQHKRAASNERKAKRIVSRMLSRTIKGGDPPAVADVFLDRPNAPVLPWQIENE